MQHRSEKEPTKFLLQNFQQIEASLKEVFGGSPDTVLQGKLEHIDYQQNCADFSDLRRGIHGNYGPGIRVIINFQGAGTKAFFYPENECPSIK